MGTSNSIVIKDGVEYEGMNGQVSIPGQVVRIENPSESTVNTFEMGSEGNKSSNTRNIQVTSGNPVNSDNPFSDIRDQFDRPVRDPRKIDSDTCSIPIGRTRCSLKTALEMNLVTVNSAGEYSMVEAPTPAEAKVPLHKTENLKTERHQATLNQLNAKVSPRLTDSFIHEITSCVCDGRDANDVISRYANAVGATDNSIHDFALDYINSLYSSGIDYAIRESKGDVSTDQIHEYLDKCSTGYRKSLLISLHLNNLGAAKEMVKAIREGKIL